MEENKKTNSLKYTVVIALICGILVAGYYIPSIIEKQVADNNANKERSWQLVTWGTLGNLDQAYNTGNTTILAVWIVNHTTDPEHYWDGYNDTADAFNGTSTVYGYAQGSSFNIQVPHSTALDLVVYVRANKTNAATGTSATDQFNDSWVMVNFTSPWNSTGSFNLSGIVCVNGTGAAYPFIYMYFVYNGSDLGVKQYDGWNDAITGNGFTLTRNQVINPIFINLSCYY